MAVTDVVQHVHVLGIHSQYDAVQHYPIRHALRIICLVLIQRFANHEENDTKGLEAVYASNLSN